MTRPADRDVERPVLKSETLDSKSLNETASASPAAIRKREDPSWDSDTQTKSSTDFITTMLTSKAGRVVESVNEDTKRARSLPTLLLHLVEREQLQSEPKLKLIGVPDD